MKPIVPVKQIMLAVMRETRNMQMTRVFSAFTPRLVAVSSPAPRALMSQEFEQEVREA
jgi:hypothetical protein